MARRHGRALRGQRLRASVPHGHWKTTTFIGGLRLSGMTAPMVLDGPMTGGWFLALALILSLLLPRSAALALSLAWLRVSCGSLLSIVAIGIWLPTLIPVSICLLAAISGSLAL